ncbi:hypothetical protein, partial [Pseudomonas syringae]|uniref:hypothetical protein n=1 Tax=Pseudomonas syringae TaxID=317 RepID=UPI001F079E3A
MNPEAAHLPRNRAEHAALLIIFPAPGLFDRFHRGFSRPFSSFFQRDEAPADRIPCSFVLHIKVLFYKLPPGDRVAAMKVYTANRDA